MLNRRTILTKKQQETLVFIESYTAEHGSAPTIKEIGAALKLDSLRSVTQRLESLERKGFIKRDRFQQRSIVVLNDPLAFEGMAQVPVIASVGADAMQIYAQHQYDEYISVDKKMLNPRKEIVAVRAVGNSMVDADIRNGDYVLLEVGGNPQEGDLVVAVVGEMAVVKRIHFATDAVVLKPESKNTAYQPIVMSDDSHVFGKVLRVIKMQRDEDEYRYEKIKDAENQY
jgi:repressor LexA